MVLTITAILLFMALAMEVAAIALKLTGLDMERARFQALSGITGTGFTTRESEAIASHPVRRRIVMVLMVLGHVGLAAILISVVNIPLIFAWWQILTAALVFLATLRIATDKFLLGWLDRYIEKGLTRLDAAPQALCEILTVDEEHGIAEVEIPSGHPLDGASLASAGLRKQDILVLAIRRGSSVISAPGARQHLLAGDKIVIYGNLANLQKMLG